AAAARCQAGGVAGACGSSLSFTLGLDLWIVGAPPPDGFLLQPLVSYGYERRDASLDYGGQEGAISIPQVCSQLARQQVHRRQVVEHRKRRLSLGGSRRLCRPGIIDDAASHVGEIVAQIPQLCFLSASLPVQARVRVGRGTVGGVGEVFPMPVRV